jgi:F0F1-type ATP synthase beta subunit
MNGYHARVQRHRQMLAEQAARTQEAAVSSFDWVCAPVDGITDAVAAAVPHRHSRAGGKADRSSDKPTVEPVAADADDTGTMTG